MKKFNINNQLSFLILIILAFSFPRLAYSQNAKEVCNVLRAESNSIQSQLPISVDYTTKVIGLSVVYDGKVCLMQYSYLVDTSAFLSTLRNDGLSEEDSFSWLKGISGQDYLKSAFKEMAKDAKANQFKHFSNYKNVKVMYLHAFDVFGLPTISTLVVDTEN